MLGTKWYLILCNELLFFALQSQRAKEDSFYEETSVIYRYGYLLLLFTWFRVRFYSAWMLAESMAVTAGLGAYPAGAANRPGAGPTNLQGNL